MFVYFSDLSPTSTRVTSGYGWLRFGLWLTPLQYIKQHSKKHFVVLLNQRLTNKERIKVKRGFQRNGNPTSVNKELEYPKHDDNVLVSTFRLLGTVVTLTETNNCIALDNVQARMVAGERIGSY